MRFFDYFPVIELEDIILREIRDDDSAEYFKYLSDPQVNKFVSNDDIPKTIEMAKQELRYWSELFYVKRSIYWAIARKKDNIMIGTCGFNTWNKTHARVEISYDLARKYWNKGIMTRALRSVCDFAFINMDVIRIQATVALDNFASIKVLEKLDFKQEGRMRSYGILHSQIKDFFMYSLLISDLSF